MQPVIQPYYTVSGLVLLQAYDQHAFELPEKVQLNILLDIPATSFPALFRIIHLLGRPFLFSLPASLAIDQNLIKTFLPACWLLSVMDNFAALSAPFIPLLADDKTQTAAISSSQIKQYFYEQGIEQLDLPVFDHSSQSHAVQQCQSCSFLLYREDQPGKTTAIAAATLIIGFAIPPANIAAFNLLVGQVTCAISVTPPEGHWVNKKSAEEELKYWQKRSLLYRHFLQLSKTVQEQEYYEVVNWYRREYEILPLWYKRFGHILKVIMGKRSFRSLFSDNVKKYKD